MAWSSFSFFSLYILFFIVIWLCLAIIFCAFSSFSSSIFLEFSAHLCQYFSNRSSFHYLGLHFLSYRKNHKYQFLLEFTEFLFLSIGEMFEIFTTFIYFFLETFFSLYDFFFIQWFSPNIMLFNILIHFKAFSDIFLLLSQRHIVGLLFNLIE